MRRALSTRPGLRRLLPIQDGTPMSARRTALGLLLVLPLVVRAQETPTCRHPHPLPRCARFWSLELEMARALVSTGHQQRVFATLDSTQLVRIDEAEDFMVWRLGLMRNKTTTRAVGLSAELGFSAK